MPEHLRESLITTFPDMGSAMVAQTVLEAAGVPCRIADTANVPGHLLGIAGGLGRSVGLWVLDIDVERATSLLEAGNGVDEAALTAEAMAAATTRAEEQQDEVDSRPAEAEQIVGTAESVSPAIQPTHSPWLRLSMFAFIAAAIAVVAYRGCH